MLRLGGDVGTNYQLPLLAQKGWKCAQIFLNSAHSKLSLQDVCTYKSIMKNTEMHLYSHACLGINLASTDEHKWDHSYSLLEAELSEVTKIGMSAVVHIGWNGILNNVHAALKNLSIIPKRKVGQPYVLLMENSASDGKKLGGTIEDLRTLFEPIDSNEGIGLCFDTQHAFGAGLTKWDNLEVFDLLDSAVGLNRLSLIHFNDSKVEFNSHKDRHMTIGSGYIWHEKWDKLKLLLDFASEKQIDMCLETATVDDDFNNVMKFYTQ